MWKGKQKAWVALLMPVIVTLIFGALDVGLGIKVDPAIQTALTGALTGGAVYQVANK